MRAARCPGLRCASTKLNQENATLALRTKHLCPVYCFPVDKFYSQSAESPLQDAVCRRAVRGRDDCLVFDAATTPSPYKSFALHAGAASRSLSPAANSNRDIFQ